MRAFYRTAAFGQEQSFTTVERSDSTLGLLGPKMKKTASIQAANIFAKVSAIFMLVGAVIAIAAIIWDPRGFPICFVPLAVGFLAKQREARMLRSALEPKVDSMSSVDSR
jgi:hypothetical protein